MIYESALQKFFNDYITNNYAVNVITEENPTSTIGTVTNDNISNVTPEQISTTDAECRFLIITASPNNTGGITIGGSTLSTYGNGIILYPAESIQLNVNNVNLIYAIAEINGEDATITYFN